MLSDTRWSLDTLVVPMPTEAVGRKARWSWTLPTLGGGVLLDHHFEATLVKRRGSRMLVEVAVTAAPDADSPMSGWEVESLLVEGHGTVWIDLARPLPERASFRVDIAMNATVVDDAGEHPMHLVAESRIGWVTRETTGR